MASREDIDRVKSAVNILDVVAPYVSLKRSGAIWKGLCPFHSEKTPSFDINPTKGLWYCRGQCAEGGDVFKFLEKIDNLTFGEAVERLAKMAGITLSDTRESSAELNQREKLYRALEVATLYYREALAQSETAKQYLINRGISHEMQTSFRLGYAGDSYDGLVAYLRRNRVDPMDAVEAGVLTASDRGPYDKLRGRIICPIVDIHDRPIAFGGRQMEDIKDRPKYINTAETPLFSKGRTFYAMSRARNAIGEQGFAVVVEGYFDVISAHQAGFKNVVATLGTALTPEHADILHRLVQRVILAFDADPAGFKAAQRSNAIFEGKDFEVQVLDMPKGEDPDSLLRVGRVAEFQRAIDDAVPIREFQLRLILDQYPDAGKLTERKRLEIIERHIGPILKSTADKPLEAERYVRMCARMHPLFEQGAGIAEHQLKQEFMSFMASANRPMHAARRKAAMSVDQPFAIHKSRDNTKSSPVRQSAIQLAEENLLRALIGDDETLSKMILEDKELSPDLFVTSENRQLARCLLLGERVEDLTVRLDGAPDSDSKALLGIIAKLSAPRVPTVGENPEPTNKLGAETLTEAVVQDCINKLRDEKLAAEEKQKRELAVGEDVAAILEYQTSVRNRHLGPIIKRPDFNKK